MGTFKHNSDGTRASSTESELQPDGSTLSIGTTWTYDADGRLLTEVQTTSSTPAANESGMTPPPDGLATWFVLPDAYAADLLNMVDGQTPMTWNETAFISPGMDSSDIADNIGAVLLQPADGAAYGGNGSDWVLVTSDGQGDLQEWSFSLSDGTLTPDGVVSSSDNPPSMTVGLADQDYSDTYTYDLSSNRMSDAHTGPGGGPSQTITYHYNGDNELTTQSSALQGTTTSTYDNNGSLISQVSTTTPVYHVNLNGSFGEGGIVMTSGTLVGASAQAILSNGDILIVGTNGDNDLALAEYNPDGTLNTSFGEDGIYISTISGLSGNAITTLSNGDILVAGQVNNPSTNLPTIAVAEFYPTGNIVSSFGSAGVAMVTSNLEMAGALSMTVLSNGDILVAGTSDQVAGGKLAMAEFTSSGSLNTSFGSGGIVQSSLQSFASANAVTVLSNGDILLAGYENDDAALAEYTSSGTPDTSFNSNGIKLINDDGAWQSITVLGNGEILAAGFGYGSDGEQDMALALFTSTGALDSSFGTDGVSWTYLGGEAAANVVTVLPSCDILTAGYVYNDDDGNSDVLLAEFKPNGTLDTTFGGSGTAIIAVGVYGGASAMNVLPDGDILISGSAGNYNGGYAFLAEYSLSGSAGGYSSTSSTTTYTYDVRNTLVKIADNGVTQATYVYDDVGDRVQETVGNVTTYFLTDTQNPTGYDQPVEEKSSPTATPTLTFILGDQVIGQSDSTGTVTYLLTDGHGSTRLMTNSTGIVTAAFNYDAFGTALNFNAGMATTPYLYGGGGIFDAPSGMYMYGDGTRQEIMGSPDFLESDTITITPGDVLNANLHLLVGGDPVNATDPDGHDIDGILDSIGMIGFGAVVNVVSAPTTRPATQQGLLTTFPFEPPARLPFVPNAGTFNAGLSYPVQRNNLIGSGTHAQTNGVDFNLNFFPTSQKSPAVQEVKFEQWIFESRSWSFLGILGGNTSTNGFVIDDGGLSDTSKQPAFYPKQTPWEQGQGLLGASMDDSPNYSGDSITRFFIDYAICTKGTDANKILGTFRWGYTMNSSTGMVTLFMSGKPSVTVPIGSTGSISIGNYVPND